MTSIEGIILAIIEGITEYLPISSTGHMIIASSLMKIAGDDFTKLFTIVIQLGAILSVLGAVLETLFSKFGFLLQIIGCFYTRRHFWFVIK